MFASPREEARRRKVETDILKNLAKCDKLAGEGRYKEALLLASDLSSKVAINRTIIPDATKLLQAINVKTYAISVLLQLPTEEAVPTQASGMPSASAS